MKSLRKGVGPLAPSSRSESRDEQETISYTSTGRAILPLLSIQRTIPAINWVAESRQNGDSSLLLGEPTLTHTFAFS